MSNMPAEKLGEHEKRLMQEGLTPAPGGPVRVEEEPKSDANDKLASKPKPKSAPAKASQPVKRSAKR